MCLNPFTWTHLALPAIVISLFIDLFVCLFVELENIGKTGQAQAVKAAEVNYSSV